MKKFLFGVLAAMCTAFPLAAVNVSTASSAELEALPGIGPAKARVIVEYCQRNDMFKSMEELKNVKGVGDAVPDKLKVETTISPATSKATQSVVKKQARFCPYVTLWPNRLPVGPGVTLFGGGDEAWTSGGSRWVKG